MLLNLKWSTHSNHSNVGMMDAVPDVVEAVVRYVHFFTGERQDRTGCIERQKRGVVSVGG
jgi:hypothetical protein